MAESDDLQCVPSDMPTQIVSLDYLTARPSPGSDLSFSWASIAIVGKVLFGAILATLLWASVGLYHMDRFPPLVGESRTLHALSMRIAIFYFTIFGISIILLFVLRKGHQHLLIGLLIGSAVASFFGAMMFAS